MTDLITSLTALNEHLKHENEIDQVDRQTIARAVEAVKALHQLKLIGKASVTVSGAQVYSIASEALGGE